MAINQIKKLEIPAGTPRPKTGASSNLPRSIDRAFVTIIRAITPSKVNKRFFLDEEGALKKVGNGQLVEGEATTHEIAELSDLVSLFQTLTEGVDRVIILERFKGAKPGDLINVVTKSRLARLCRIPEPELEGRVYELGGKLYAARTKDSFEPGPFLLADADIPDGMPDEYAVLAVGERLKLLEDCVPGISRCDRVEFRSSSSRVRMEGELPGGATHGILQISDPGKLDQLREVIKVKSRLRGLSFSSPTKSGALTYKTLIDEAVISQGRLVFAARPDVEAPGYLAHDANVTFVTGERRKLDVSALENPSPALLAKVREVTGERLSYATVGTSTHCVDESTLTRATLIDVNGTLSPFGEIVDGMPLGTKIRCQAPFRESSSQAAFIRKPEKSPAFLFDVGVGTKYIAAEDISGVLDEGAASQFGEALAYSSVSAEFCSDVKPTAAELLKDPAAFVRPAGKAPAQNEANVIEMFERAAEWHGVFGFNVLSQDVTLRKPVPGSRTPRSTFRDRPLQDEDVTLVVAWFNRRGFPGIGRQKIIDGIAQVSQEHSYSPVAEYLESVKPLWDPELHPARIPSLLQRYFGAVPIAPANGPACPYLDAVARVLMIGSVARALKPGCKHDSVVVIEGEQGVGKSSGIRALYGAKYFSDSLPDLRSKDASEHLRGVWCVELAELAGLSRVEVNAVKAFVSRQQERFRPAYGRRSIIYPRQCVFVGTTNREDYLRDKSGNRRFLPVKANQVDVQAIVRDRDLLWAEALYRYRNGEPWHLSGTAADFAAKQQSLREEEDLWLATVRLFLSGQFEACVPEVAVRLGLDSHRVTPAERRRIEAILVQLGFRRDGRVRSGAYQQVIRFTRFSDESS